ncbi:S24/S26 family peptidase [Methanobrevibacter sp. DSM 116169]|uniref:S24/S26 family peptidase n=1 Tax=Methanobrevibacter sp. DSM 116169 TaxID=3242727 RepID=UPI0038FCCC25
MFKSLKSKIAILLILIILICGFLTLSNSGYVDIYLDGENVTTSFITIPFLYDNNEIIDEINDYALNNSYDNFDSNVSDLKNGIGKITHKHGIDNTIVKIDSSYGENQIPIIFLVNGTSMEPTLKDGQDIVILKTKNINVGDIVVCDSPEYGIIVKRVSEINGDRVYLTSDNKNSEITNINGVEYVSQGITTWENISNIMGVVEKY